MAEGEKKRQGSNLKKNICKRCNVTQVCRAGSRCLVCFNLDAAERLAADKEELERQKALGVSEKLWAMRWVVRNPGVAAEGMRLYYQQMCERSPRDFEARLDAEEARYAESQAEEEEVEEAPLEDDGLERALEQADRWLAENGVAGQM